MYVCVCLSRSSEQVKFTPRVSSQYSSSRTASARATHTSAARLRTACRNIRHDELVLVSYYSLVHSSTFSGSYRHIRPVYHLNDARDTSGGALPTCAPSRSVAGVNPLTDNVITRHVETLQRMTIMLVLYFPSFPHFILRLIQ